MLGVGGQRNSTGEPPPRWEIEHYESNVPSLPGKFLAPYLDGKICGSKLLKTVIMGHRQRDALPPIELAVLGVHGMTPSYARLN